MGIVYHELKRARSLLLFLGVWFWYGRLSQVCFRICARCLRRVGRQNSSILIGFCLLLSPRAPISVGSVDKIQAFCSVFVGFGSVSTASKHPANTQKSARPLTATRRFLSNVKHIISNPVQTKAARSFSPHMTKATVSSAYVRCEDAENRYAVFRQCYSSQKLPLHHTSC